MPGLLDFPTELLCACIQLLSQSDHTALSAVCKHIHSRVDEARYWSLELTDKSPSQLYSLAKTLSRNPKRIFRLTIETNDLASTGNIVPFTDTARVLQWIPNGSETDMAFWRDIFFSDQCANACIAYVILHSPVLRYLHVAHWDSYFWNTFVTLIRPQLLTTHPSLLTTLMELKLLSHDRPREPTPILSLFDSASTYSDLRKLTLCGTKSSISLGMRLLKNGTLPQLRVLYLADTCWNDDTNYSEIPSILAEKGRFLTELALDFESHSPEAHPIPWSTANTLTTLDSITVLRIHCSLLFDRTSNPTYFGALTTFLPAGLRSLCVTGFFRREMYTLFKNVAAKEEFMASLRAFLTLESCRLILDYDIRSADENRTVMIIRRNGARRLRRGPSERPLQFDVWARWRRETNTTEVSVTQVREG